MLSAHIVKSYDQELQRLERIVLKMGELVVAQLRDALGAITGDHPRYALEIVANDDPTDHLARQIESLTLQMLALRQPMALDLRAIVAALRISIDLERIGDYAANIVKRSSDLPRSDFQMPIQALVNMGTLALGMILNSLDAYRELDAGKAADIWHHDQYIDQEYTEFLHELQTAMSTQSDKISESTCLLFAARGIERIGDHVTNIAEHIYYLVEGAPLQQAFFQQAEQRDEGSALHPARSDQQAES